MIRGKRKLFNRFFFLLLVLAMAATALSAAFHRHEGEFHGDCSICVFQVNQQSLNVEPSAVSFMPAGMFAGRSDVMDFFIVVLYSGTTAFPHAPPVTLPL